MTIESRLNRIEQEMGIGLRRRPFVLIVTAGGHQDDLEYEARLRRRTEDAIRRRPKDPFILLL